MTAKRWLSIVLPTGLLLGLALGWMTAGAQSTTMIATGTVDSINFLVIDNDPLAAPIDSDEWHCPDNSAGKSYHFRGALYICVPGNGFTRVAGQPTPWPHFKQHPQGWMPSCPAGMTLIRHDPPPDCLWGTRPMSSKPTQGDMECVYTAQATKLPACPKE
jgi:hypothetical protein